MTPPSSADEPDELTPAQAAADAWRLLADALAEAAQTTYGAGGELKAYADTALALHRHAAALAVPDGAGVAAAELRALRRRAGAVLEEARALGADTFEGRLELLGARLGDLGEALR